MTETLDQILDKKKKFLIENKEYKRAEYLTNAKTTGNYIVDLVYGANDGLITTFAIIAGAAGASLSPLIIVILGLSNIIADGISMGASNYLGGKSEIDFAKNQRQKEAWEIEHLRELEVEEIKDIYAKKGFKGKALEDAVVTITSNKKVWIDTMMLEELGIIEEVDDPKSHAFVTFGAFVVAGFIPLLPFLLPIGFSAFTASMVIGGVTLFIIGAARSFVTTVSFLRGGLEMFLVGSSAAIAAYSIGAIVEKIVR